MNALGDLFPPEDYRFHLTLRRGDATAFFAPTPDGPVVCAERRRWLEAHPGRHAGLLPGGRPLLAEFARMTGFHSDITVGELGALLEPDFLLLAADESGRFCLQGGALCFPSRWALEEKLGQTLDVIHGIVPGLNPAMGGSIQQFLTRLQAGPGYLRANWGLAATPALNLHPALPHPQLTEPLDPARIWLRVERQLLARLPETGGVLFGIRIEVHPLAVLLEDPDLRAVFHRALTTMPDALAAYKGLAPVRAALAALSMPT